MKRRWQVRAIKSIVIAAIAFGCIQIVVLLFSGVVAPITKLWSESSGERAPDFAFYAVGFPRSSEIELRAGDGEFCGRLDRAVLVSLDQWESGQPVGVYTSATTKCLAQRSDLTVDPSQANDPRVLLFNAGEFYFYTFDPETDLVARFEHFERPSGEQIVTVYHADGDYYISEYRVEGGEIRPLAVWRHNARTAGMVSFVVMLISILAAMLAFSAYWMLVLARSVRFRVRSGPC